MILEMCFENNDTLCSTPENLYRVVGHLIKETDSKNSLFPPIGVNQFQYCGDGVLFFTKQTKNLLLFYCVQYLPSASYLHVCFPMSPKIL